MVSNNPRGFFLLTSLFILFAASVFLTGPVFALTIDAFDGDGGTASSGPPAFTNISHASAVGGMRELMTDRLSGSLNVRVDVLLGLLSHSQNVGVTGQSHVIWDGISDNTIFSGDGLAGIDFTQDGGTAIKITSTDTDHPLALTVTVYDASSPTGQKFSEYTLNLSGADPLILIPFSSFTQGAGATGPADFTNVGAVKLFIFGNNAKTDFDMNWIGTNGTCVDVPVNGVVIDDCGFCIGDPNYNAPRDACGFCVGDPNYNQPKDVCGFCIGSANYNQPKDSCGFCIGDPNYNQPKDSCGFCIGDANYNAPTDGCGFCINDPNYNQAVDSCGLCVGDPNYGKALDDCGVCFGNNKDIDDCGVCKGTNGDKDVCGICGGDGTSCLDCKGEPFGTATTDACGICEGDGSSCLDCSNLPFGTATVDRCGVCDGDGNSCLNCNVNSLEALLVAMGEKSLDQKRNNLTCLKGLGSGQRSFKKATKNRTVELYNQLLALIGTFPLSVTQCDNTEFCEKLDVNLASVPTYGETSKEIFKLTKKIVRKLRGAHKDGVCESTAAQCKLNAQRRNREFRRCVKTARTLYRENKGLPEGGLPSFETVCQGTPT
ncbi:hypothetical protein OAO01_02030 [Oligoflexia bacterium]|nr:hypothetical protein [Oligoflexia bacterium]